MPLFPSPPVIFINARVYAAGGASASSLRMAGDRIIALDGRPDPGDVVIDLQGDIILPGLINAHDHLELNNFPRLKWRDRYANAGEWIADFQPRFQTDPDLSAAMSVALSDRLLLGAMKNLLSGATTVCHHNPLHGGLRRRCPVRVVRHYGYSHSLLIDREQVTRSHQKTPKDWPWIIHAAEGTDAAAAAEFDQLNRWNCIGPNTVLVHGVGLSMAQQEVLIDKGSGLIWCPSSNEFLLGATADVSNLARVGRTALGTDARLSGDRDLLREIQFAATRHHVSARVLLQMVTVHAAALLRLPEAGVLRPGVPADLLILPASSGEPCDSILETDRSRVRLVVLGGKAQIGDAHMLPVFTATRVRHVEVSIDGRAKLMAKTLVDRMRRCAAQEPGLEL